MSENKEEKNAIEENKEIEVITGDGKDLKISPVYDHIKIDKRDKSQDKNKKIIIPDTKK